MADPVLKTICHEFHWLRRLSLGFVIRTLRKGGVARWTMAGKFHKHWLYRPWRWLHFLPDWQLLRFYYSRRRRANNDDSLMLGLIAEFQAAGLDCVSALDLCPELLVREGVLTRRRPSPAEEQDIAMGWNLAREMGRLDIGQSVMVRERAVLAVEAIEGTDRAIARAGELCSRRGFVVVKVAKPEQDRRFDVPTVGKQTIESMHAAGAAFWPSKRIRPFCSTRLKCSRWPIGTASRSPRSEPHPSRIANRVNSAAISRCSDRQLDRKMPVRLSRSRPAQA